jgi:hypothetical protein
MTALGWGRVEIKKKCADVAANPNALAIGQHDNGVGACDGVEKMRAWASGALNVPLAVIVQSTHCVHEMQLGIA